jgi:tRNA(His) 5'-end guanylyltransferase
MRKDKLGDRMKRYELSDDRRLMPLLPIVIRMDGIAFSTFTRGLKRPYDERLSTCMIETTKGLVERWHATLGYTQSDEITIFLKNDDPMALMPYDGRVQKLIGAFASSVTGKFIRQMNLHLPEKVHKDPEFDCRVWQLPNMAEVFNMFLWRESDATTNSIQMAAQSQYSHKQLHKKGWSDLNEMLFQKGINYNDYPAFFKRGTYARRTVVHRILTAEELNKIPDKHRHLHQGIVTRSELIAIDMPAIHSIKGGMEELLGYTKPRALLG